MKKIKLLIAISLGLLSSTINAATFTAEPLPEKMRHRLYLEHDWHPGCPVPLNRLNQLTVSYYDFRGEKNVGHLVVFDAAAPFILHAFRKMYEMHYPLEPLSESGDESTSAFNCRAVVGETKYSLHSYGLAIDINISRNPYLGSFHENDAGRMSGQLVPNLTKSYTYLNRAVQRPGMNEKIVSLMAQSGFIVWGGQWQDRVDYQHFQVPNDIATHMAYMDKSSAEKLMRLMIQYPNSAKKMSDNSKWSYLYHLYPDNFINALAYYFPLLDKNDENDVFNLVYEKLSSRQPAE